MNLTNTPFIPVKMSDGNSSMLSLLDIFEKSASISDLSLSTHERIAVMRLLICVTQASIGFPEDKKDWQGFGDNLEQGVKLYLTDWHTSFELLGDQKRFLQTKLPSSEKLYSYDQLMFSTASGNTPTLLDQRNIKPPAPEEIALALLCYQNFFIGGSMASKVKGNGPALKSLHTFLKGKNLKETILLNCLDEETCRDSMDLGRPIWEQPENVGNATKTYLGRLVPTPCKIWLNDNKLKPQIDQGFIYPEFPEVAPEASTAIRVATFGKKEEEKLLRANLAKGIWRDLHCLLAKKSISNSKGLPPAILTSHPEIHNNREISLWSGELYKAIDAKIVDAIESSFTLPIELLDSRSLTLYEDGARHADFRAKLLADAVRAYGKSFKIDKPDASAAIRSFWHNVSLNTGKLIHTATHPELLDKVKFGISSDPWSRFIHRAAEQAFNEFCPVGSPREHKAHVEGFNKLLPRKKKPTSKK